MCGFSAVRTSRTASATTASRRERSSIQVLRTSPAPTAPQGSACRRVSKTSRNFMSNPAPTRRNSAGAPEDRSPSPPNPARTAGMAVFEYVRNDWFDARNYFDHGVKQAPLRLNQFGGSIGGPIRKDKLFFFASQENLLQRVYVTFRQTTLSDLARSQAVPAIRPLLAAFPAGQSHTADPLQDLVSGTLSSYINEYFGNFRLDYYINNRHSVYMRYSRDQGESISPSDISGSGTFNNTVPQNGAHPAELHDERRTSLRLFLATQGSARSARQRGHRDGVADSGKCRSLSCGKAGLRPAPGVYLGSARVAESNRVSHWRRILPRTRPERRSEPADLERHRQSNLFHGSGLSDRQGGAAQNFRSERSERALAAPSVRPRLHHSGERPFLYGLDPAGASRRLRPDRSLCRQPGAKPVSAHDLQPHHRSHDGSPYRRRNHPTPIRRPLRRDGCQNERRHQHLQRPELELEPAVLPRPQLFGELYMGAQHRHIRWIERGHHGREQFQLYPGARRQLIRRAACVGSKRHLADTRGCEQALPVRWQPPNQCCSRRLADLRLRELPQRASNQCAGLAQQCSLLEPADRRLLYQSGRQRRSARNCPRDQPRWRRAISRYTTSGSCAWSQSLPEHGIWIPAESCCLHPTGPGQIRQ